MSNTRKSFFDKYFDGNIIPTEGSVSYPSGTLETPMFEYTNNGTLVRVVGYLDLNAFTAGRVLTARTYIRTDGTNYRQYDTVNYTIGAGNNHPSFDVATIKDFRVTLQINLTEGVSKSVPVSVVVFY